MIKFDCGRAPGLEKRVKREPEEADRPEAKVEGLGEGGGWRSALIGRPRPIQLKEQGRVSLQRKAPPLEGWRAGTLTAAVSLFSQVTCSPRERPSHRPTPEFKIKTKSYRRESILNSSPNAGPKRTPEPPGSAEGRGVFPCRECERYQPFPRMCPVPTPPALG